MIPDWNCFGNRELSEQESLELNLTVSRRWRCCLTCLGGTIFLTSSIIKQSNLMKFDFSRVGCCIQIK